MTVADCCCVVDVCCYSLDMFVLFFMLLSASGTHRLQHYPPPPHPTPANYHHWAWGGWSSEEEGDFGAPAGHYQFQVNNSFIINCCYFCCCHFSTRLHTRRFSPSPLPSCSDWSNQHRPVTGKAQITSHDVQSANTFHSHVIKLRPDVLAQGVHVLRNLACAYTHTCTGFAAGREIPLTF